MLLVYSYLDEYNKRTSLNNCFLFCFNRGTALEKQPDMCVSTASPRTSLPGLRFTAPVCLPSYQLHYYQSQVVALTGLLTNSENSRKFRIVIFIDFYSNITSFLGKKKHFYSPVNSTSTCDSAVISTHHCA